MCETDSINALTRSRIRTVIGLAMMEPRYLLMAPTLGAIDMPLSFSTMMMSRPEWPALRSEEHTSELQSRLHLVCRLLLEKKKKETSTSNTKTRDLRGMRLSSASL